jgi:hypothetical protein
MDMRNEQHLMPRATTESDAEHLPSMEQSAAEFPNTRFAVRTMESRRTGQAARVASTAAHDDRDNADVIDGNQTLDE